MNLKELLKRCVRIILTSRKPTREEFMKVSKVTSLGVVIIGVLGVFVAFIFGLIG